MLDKEQGADQERAVRVLVVDDEPMIVEMLLIGLSYEGFAVSVARTGPEAVDQARSTKPEVVVLDIMLPGLDGIAVCKRLRAQGDMGILMLTARGEVEDRIKGLESGADDYLVKPFSFRELLARVRAPLWRVPVGLQLSAVYAVLLVATLAVLGGALYTQLDGFLVQNTADRLHQAANTLVRRNPGFPPRPRGPEEATPQASNASNPTPGSVDRASPPDLQAGFLVRGLSAPDVTVALLDPAGTVISSTVAVDAGVRRPLPVLPTGWLAQVPDAATGGGASQPTVQWVLATAGGGRQLVVAQRIAVTSPAGTTPDHLVLLQAASLDAADAILDRLRLYLILGVLIGAAVGVLAGLGLTRAVLQPLDRMTRTAEAIAGGDLTRRLRLPAGRNEVARLGSAFDHMVDRLAATLHAQRRFVADASHELRTPLTSLEGLSEMLLLGADRGDSQAVQRIVRAIYGELGRMGRLVTDLLTLSRLDSAAPLAAISVDLGQLLDDVAGQVAHRGGTAW